MPWLEPAGGQPVDSLFPPDFLDHWQRLAATTGQADPACCAPAWQLSFHEIFTPERRVFFAQNSTSAIIFSEFAADDGRFFLLPLEDSWLFGQPLLGVHAPLLLASSLPELVRSGRMPQILVSGVMQPSFLASSLYNQFSPAFSFFGHRECVEASASLENGLDGWLSRRSANCRAKLRKALRHADAEGVTFERVRPAPGQADAIYSRIVAVERRSWKGINHCGMAESPSVEFYEALLKRYARNNAALVIFARRENDDIGFIFGGLCGNIYRGQQFSYDNDYARLSLGNVMQFKKIEWLCELGMARYDMGPSTGERMAYKLHWTELATPVNTWLMRR